MVKGMIDDLLGDFSESLGGISRTLTESLGVTPTRTIVVAKPYCSPARNAVLTALQPYGVVIRRLTDYIDYADFNGREVPIAEMARVTVNEQAAVWAEYLLLRSGKLEIRSPYLDPRNQQWAKRHAGAMPPRWVDGKPWIERGCKDGINAWKAAKGKRG